MRIYVDKLEQNENPEEPLPYVTLKYPHVQFGNQLENNTQNATQAIWCGSACSTEPFVLRIDLPSHCASSPWSCADGNFNWRAYSTCKSLGGGGSTSHDW